MADLETEIKPPGNPPMQFAVMLKNRAGALSSLVRLMRNSKIDVIGLSVLDSRDATVARMVVSDCDAAQALFLEKGIAHTTSRMVVIALTETGQGLADALDVLHAAETNLDFAYSLMVQHQGRPLLAMHLEDTHFGISVLSTAGFKVLFEEDLLR